MNDDLPITLLCKEPQYMRRCEPQCDDCQTPYTCGQIEAEFKPLAWYHRVPPFKYFVFAGLLLAFVIHAVRSA